MTIKSRREVREQLGALLNAALVGSGLPAQRVYDYMKSDIEGESPVVCIGSSSFLADEQNFTSWYVVYTYDLAVLVARADEAGAEDNLDDTMQGIFECLESQRVSAGWWQSLDWTVGTQIVPVTVSGDPYWLETVTIEVTCYS